MLSVFTYYTQKTLKTDHELSEVTYDFIIANNHSNHPCTYSAHDKLLYASVYTLHAVINAVAI